MLYLLARTRDRGKDAVRLFGGCGGGDWSPLQDHSLYRSPETSLLAAKSHNQGKSWVRPTDITTHLLGRLRNQLQALDPGQGWNLFWNCIQERAVFNIWFHELRETRGSIFWWIWFNLQEFHKKLELELGRRHLAQLSICQGLSLAAPDHVFSSTIYILLDFLVIKRNIISDMFQTWPKRRNGHK